MQVSVMICRTLAVEKILLDQLIRMYRNKPSLFSAYCNSIMPVYCLVKAIQLYNTATRV